MNNNDDGEQGPVDDAAQEKIDSHVHGRGAVKYTYDKALAAKGISKDSEAYTRAIDKGMIFLREHRTFFGYIVDEMVRVITYDIKTAAVGMRDGNLVMYMNPDFMALLSIRERAGVIQHECIHVIASHLTRMLSYLVLGYNDRFLNIAMDLAVNSLIDDPRDLPKFCIKTTQFKMPDPMLPREKWPDIPGRKTFEWYVEALKKIAEANKDQDCADGIPVMNGAGGNGAPVPDVGEPDETLDDHGLWSQQPEGGLTQEIISEIIRDKIRSAVNKARSRGHSPGSCQEIIDKLLKDKTVDFASLFAGMIGRYVCNIRRTTMMRPSRRYPAPPGRVMSRKLKLIAYVDTSGSMATDEIRIILSECRHAQASGLAEVEIQQFDHGLQGEKISAIKMGDVEVGIKGRGGTSLAQVIADIDIEQPDLAIIGTDGGLEHNIKPKTQTPVVWLVTSNGAAPPWGPVLRLPTIEEIRAGKRAMNVPGDQRAEHGW